MEPQAVLAGLGLGWARVAQKGVAVPSQGHPWGTPRGEHVTNISVFWWAPARQNMTMLGPEAELYGVESHSGVVRG